jgi:hypothetical protein
MEKKEPLIQVKERKKTQTITFQAETVKYLKKPTKTHDKHISHTHIYIYIDQCGMRKKTTDKHTEANYNSRMKCTT